MEPFKRKLRSRLRYILGRNIIAAIAISFAATGIAQRPATVQHAVTAVTASLGPLLPGISGAPPTAALRFRLSLARSAGVRAYQINAVSNFVFTPVAPAEGGKSITASDLGLGVAGISLQGVTGNVIIAEGFNYDPSTVKGRNGQVSYEGATSGRATLADLLSGREILRIENISGSRVSAGPIELTLTLRFAMQPQFLTPGSFSGAITLFAVEITS
jgi:hypothetical protein